LPSLLVLYDGEKVETRNLPGRLRGLAWDQKGSPLAESSLTLVGNAGRMLRIEIKDVKDHASLATATPSVRPVSVNLRSVSINPIDNTALIVGNAGTVIASKPDGVLAKMYAPSSENLRAASWNWDGRTALIAGNNGALLHYTEHGLEPISGGRANMRGISWRKNMREALITSNCFAEEFIPSPNLFLFDAVKNTLNPVSEGRSDLIGVDWNPDGNLAAVVGYDVVWHTGFIGTFDGSNLSPLPFQWTQVYPTAVSWDPTGRTAAIATCVAQPHSGQGRIILWNGETFREIYRNEDFFFTSIAWSPVGFKLAAIASTEARTFDS